MFIVWNPREFSRQCTVNKSSLALCWLISAYTSSFHQMTKLNCWLIENITQSNSGSACSWIIWTILSPFYFATISFFNVASIWLSVNFLLAQCYDNRWQSFANFYQVCKLSQTVLLTDGLKSPVRQLYSTCNSDNFESFQLYNTFYFPTIIQHLLSTFSLLCFGDKLCSFWVFLTLQYVLFPNFYSTFTFYFLNAVLWW